MSYAVLTQGKMKRNSIPADQTSLLPVSELAVLGFRSVRYSELPRSAYSTITVGV